MFDFLKKGNNAPDDVKTIRRQLLLFIKDQLRKIEGGEGGHIKVLQLFIAAGADQHLYESATYAAEPGRFRDAEVQRIADDFAIDLPVDWTMEIFFVADLPPEASAAPQMPVALAIVTRRAPASRTPANAVVRVLNGEAEQEIYQINPGSGRVYIGRDKKVQTQDGFFRENTIAFPSAGAHDGNKYVSRSHAHIEWDATTGCYCLYADEGGIPPRNKVKVQRTGGGQVRLQTTDIAHHLEPGDKIMLGASVLLEFDYIKEED